MLLPTDQLLTGTIDFFSDRPVEVTVLMCDPKTDIELFLLWLNSCRWMSIRCAVLLSKLI